MIEAFIRRLSSASAGFEAGMAELRAVGAASDEAIDIAAAAILADVEKRGDEALLEYTRRFDRLDIHDAGLLELDLGDATAALNGLDKAVRHALEQAAGRIRSFHEKQKAQSWEYTSPEGTLLGQRVSALDRAGIYVPGGRAAYPSSVLMNAVPAKVAGVGEIVMVVPTPGGERNPVVLAAAAVAGVDRIFTIGGAQAIGALAYGTATVPAVDKIVGPGNAYVAAAKRRVFGKVGIDMIAGPSEILVIGDGSADPDWIAMDLFSQAEHDEMAQSILLCPDLAYLDQVEASMRRLLPGLPRRQIIAASLSGRGALIHVRTLEEACDIANRLAPEHLELAVQDPKSLLPRIRHAGAIFLGNYSSEALGDYCAGPNHVLPTSGTARFSSPLGVYDFQKRTSLIGATAESARTLGDIASCLAQAEGLQAHARSADFRRGLK
jgi:histidinol dehydrogenase